MSYFELRRLEKRYAFHLEERIEQLMIVDAGVQTLVTHTVTAFHGHAGIPAPGRFYRSIGVDQLYLQRTHLCRR